MIDVVQRLLLLMKRDDRVRNEIDVDDVQPVVGAQRQHAPPRQENKRPHHVELRGLAMAAVAQHDAGPENGERHVRAGVPAPCARRTFSCAHRDHSPTAPSQWRRPR